MSALRLRPAVRALLLDPDDRVLLVRFDFPDLLLWTAPGGGVDPGESPLEALRRELIEEVGLELPPDAVPPLVWHRPIVGDGIARGWDGQTDDFYLVRTAAFEPRGVFSDEELLAEGVGAVRWWTQAELEAPGTVFGPRELPGLLVELLHDGPPAAPVLVGW